METKTFQKPQQVHSRGTLPAILPKNLKNELIIFFYISEYYYFTNYFLLSKGEKS
jgi:hypothetical protein